MNIDNFFKNGKLSVIPRKKRAKEELLYILASKFQYDKNYSEKEVNDILIKIYDDYALLRRYLVDTGYLKRDIYGRHYWRVKKENK